MSEKKYISLMSFFEEHTVLKSAVLMINRFITYLIFACYPLFLCYLLYIKSSKILTYVLVPLVSFVLISVFRVLFNAKRPYEKYNFQPIKTTEKKGKSFPSRHVFSAAIISFMFLDFNIYLGIVFLILSVILAALRVLCGVHFIKDVAGGILAALFFYLITIFLL